MIGGRATTRREGPAIVDNFRRAHRRGPRRRRLHHGPCRRDPAGTVLDSDLVGPGVTADDETAFEYRGQAAECGYDLWDRCQVRAAVRSCQNEV